MVNKNGIDYHGVWELDGKFFGLAESAVDDWHPVFKGTELWNEDGRGYVEVEYNDPAPHWTNEKIRLTSEIRSCIREMLQVKEYTAIRMILFSKGKNGVLSITDIAQFDDLNYIREHYRYNTYIDSYAKDWGGKLISLEGIKDE